MVTVIARPLLPAGPRGPSQPPPSILARFSAVPSRSDRRTWGGGRRVSGAPCNRRDAGLRIPPSDAPHESRFGPDAPSQGADPTHPNQSRGVSKETTRTRGPWTLDTGDTKALWEERGDVRTLGGSLSPDDPIATSRTQRLGSVTFASERVFFVVISHVLSIGCTFLDQELRIME